MSLSNTTDAIFDAGVDSSGNAFLRRKKDQDMLLLKLWTDGRVTLDHSTNNGSSWSSSKILTSDDFKYTDIANNYGVEIGLFTYGNNSIKTLKIAGFVNKKLAAGTEYTIATNSACKSAANWYHNVLCGGKGSDFVCYLNIDKSGNIKLTPKTEIASGIGLNMMEYYV